MSGGADKHVLVFHHIPKTAGTSFRTALYNVFGDDQCVQIKELDYLSTDQIRDALGQKGARLLCGHIPVRYVEQGWRTSAVTFVRDPIERVLSLYRFELAQPIELRAHLSLGETFTLREFLDCRDSDVTSQVDNGMCRFLARTHSGQAIDGTHLDFKASALTLYAAIESLSEMAVGVSERMEDSLRYLTALWALPSPLTAPAENRSHRWYIDALPDEIAEIAARNALDIALYRRAGARLDHALRVPPAPIGPLVEPAVLMPRRDYSLGALPARDGFNIVEREDNFSWLSKGAHGLLHFALGNPSIRSLALRIYAGPHAYPVGSVTFEINGAPVPVDWRVGADHWGTAFLGPFTPRSGTNRLAIRLPAEDPAAAPPSRDPRELTFAIASLRALSPA
jgi:hypothetical protein